MTTGSLQPSPTPTVADVTVEIAIGANRPLSSTIAGPQTIRLVPVSYADSTGWIPRPALFGAIVAKAAAATTDPIDQDRHLVDLAFLCGLVEDPIAQAREAEKGDRRRLEAAARLLPEDHPAWVEGPDDPVEARTALAILTNSQ